MEKKLVVAFCINKYINDFLELCLFYLLAALKFFLSFLMFSNFLILFRVNSHFFSEPLLKLAEKHNIHIYIKKKDGRSLVAIFLLIDYLFYKKWGLRSPKTHRY
jgi:cellulose synthase/poly-beta-1,6-N-acetylglucosamine synthase-like glycosyltransferase